MFIETSAKSGYNVKQVTEKKKTMLPKRETLIRLSLSSPISCSEKWPPRCREWSRPNVLKKTVAFS